MTEKDRNQIRLWYWSGAVLVFLILIIGGITRLTGSGLSMVEWEPIMGVVPPLTEAQWADTFEQYKEFPEYRQVNRGMSLSEFKAIFFWEYLHRMAGRVLGLVFLIPFAWFALRKKLDRTQWKRALFLLLLGLAQGLLGWYMVKSGLIDVPRVSPYRLVSHLLLAFMIFGCCVWFALDLASRRKGTATGSSELKKWLLLFIGLLILQVIWGAFVAGHHAGHIYNTFPKMNQFWMPPELWLMDPFFLNFFENMVTVQWIHRVLGTLIGILIIAMWIRSYQLTTTFRTKLWVLKLFSLVLFQYATGVFTLIYHVPVWLGVLHQAMAIILFGAAIAFYHRLHHRAVPN